MSPAVMQLVIALAPSGIDFAVALVEALTRKNLNELTPEEVKAIVAKANSPLVASLNNIDAALKGE